MGELAKQTVTGVKWSAIEKYSGQFIQFVIGLIIARILSPEEFGVVGMLSIFMSVSQAFIDCGFSQALIRKMNRSEADFSTTFHFNMAVGVLCYIILFFSAPLIAHFFHMPILKSVTRVISLNLVISAFGSVQTAQLTVNLNFKKIAIINVIGALLSGVAGIVAAYMGLGVWALVITTLGAATVTSLLLWVTSQWYPKWIFSKESFKTLFAFGGNYMLANLLSQIYFRMSDLVIGRFYTAKDLGFYARGSSIASLLSTNITAVLQKVTYPVLSKIQNEEERLIAAYRKYIKGTSMVIFFLMILLAAMAKPLILLLLTAKWTHAIIYLQLFCFAMMFDHIASINLNLLMVKGRSDLLLRLEIIKRIISFAILFASIPFGVIWICLSKIIYAQIALIINTYYTGKLFNLGYFTQLRDWIKYFMLALVSCMPTFMLTFVDIPNIVTLIVGVLGAIGLYYLLLRLTQDVFFSEAEIMAKSYIKSKKEK